MRRRHRAPSSATPSSPAIPLVATVSTRAADGSRTPKSRADGEIWLKDLTSSQERHLVTTPPSELNPVISRDGWKVAYSLPARGSVAVGLIVPASGGKPNTVCEGCVLWGWFTDNRRILATSPGTPGRIESVDVVDGTTCRTLSSIPSPRGLGGPMCSPDSRWLSFISRGRLWMVPVRPGGVPQEAEWIEILKIPEGSAERACGWSRTADYSTCCSNGTGSATCTRNASTAKAAKPSAIHCPYTHLHDPRMRLGIHVSRHRHCQWRVRVLAGQVHRRNLAAGSHRGQPRP